VVGRCRRFRVRQHRADGAFSAVRRCSGTQALARKSQSDRLLEPALVEIEDALVPALIVEKLEDGWYTILVPSAPTPMAGSIYILPPDRVHPVDIPFTTAIGVFSKWGTGAGEFVRAM
jgi:hypothetical protein